MIFVVKSLRHRTSAVNLSANLLASTASKSLQARHSSVFCQVLPRVVCTSGREQGEQQCRRFASEAAASKPAKAEAASSTPQQELTFSTPKVKELYERMIKLQKDEVSAVGEVMMEILDVTVEPDEFYYYGIGNSGGGGGGKGEAAEAEAEEEVKKDKFDLKLVGFDAKSKIKVIKEVRSMTGLGLKEAKDLVESAPKVIQKDLKAENAEELMEKLKAVGAEVELV